MIGGGLVLIALGAILRFAVHAHVAGLQVHVVGVILLVVGVTALTIGLVLRFREDAPNASAGRDG